MVKTIWVINQFAGKQDSGWGERHYYFARYWVKKGYDVNIISGSFNHLFKVQPQVSNKTFTTETIEKNITFCWVKIAKYNPESVFKLWSMMVFAFKILFLSKKVLNKPDVVLISSMPIFSVLPAYLLAKKYKAKFLFEVRDLWPQTPIHLKGYKKWHPIILLMASFEKLGYRKAEYIISVLPNSSNYINKISKKPEKWVYIPNGIDKNMVGNESVDVEIKNQIPPDKFVIGYAGTIGLANAMDDFIQASILLKNNDKIHFVMVGDGYKKEDYIKKTLGNNNITYIPKIDKAKVQDLLKLFNVCYVGRFDSPLYKHGVSYNKYFDYMLAKKPILESSSFIKDPVELSGCGLIVKPESAEAIVDGINELYNMEYVGIDKLGNVGYNYVIKHHNFKFLSDKYTQLFES
ncbi:glycosyltransferase family 4 protein [Aureibaculum conchae]|uniref:glycosyltransferase family 4 protein n=1 Tax=Aureibaculum sp. 2308TA14-22 TaxID=3108392 RepID=UPI003396D13D